MRTVVEPTYVETSNVGETKRASIKTSAKMFNFFSRQIYTDFFTAAWRELVANAIDAQKAVGETRPPVVTVPSMLEPHAKVRDFGCSMDHEFMMNQFMAFGDASTKEDSNDFIGGFGIGSKAPLAYTDQYSIKCFLNGVVRVYSVFKDDEGCPSIAFLSEAPTDEPNGVEVGFPVRQEDVTKFTDVLVRTLQYFDPLPVLENTRLKLDPIKYDAKGTRWGIRMQNGDRRSNLIVGGVAYPLNVAEIPYSHTQLRTFANLGIDIFLNIGEVNIALSREQVTHDDKLFKRLNEIMKDIGPEFGRQLSESFAKYETLWDAKAKLSEAIKNADYATSKLLRDHAVWNGEKIVPIIRRPKDFEVLVIAYGSFDWISGISGIPTTQAISPKFRAWANGGTFQLHTFNRIVIDDAPDKPSLRIRTVTEKYPDERILFLRDNDPDDDVDWKEYLKALGSPPKSMIDYLSKYEPTKVARMPNGNTSSRPFKCYVHDSRPYRGSTSSDQLPAGGGLYVVMDNFAPITSDKDIGIARKAGPKNTVWLNLTDFRSSGIENNPDWFSVEQAIAKVKDEYRSKHKNLPEAEAWYQLASNNRHVSSFVRMLPQLQKLSNFPKRGPLMHILRLHEKHKTVTSTEHSSVRKDLLGVKYDKQFQKMEKLFEDLQTKHPLIWEVIQNWQLRSNLSGPMLERLF